MRLEIWMQSDARRQPKAAAAPIVSRHANCGPDEVPEPAFGRLVSATVMVTMMITIMIMVTVMVMVMVTVMVIVITVAAIAVMSMSMPDDHGNGCRARVRAAIGIGHGQSDRRITDAIGTRRRLGECKAVTIRIV